MATIPLDSKMWPELPYRGLNYYRPVDRPLLAGRDRDVAICSSKLGHPETRVLLLHGMTGSGKSSFLRAGLIPAMEQEGSGYLFLRTLGAEDEALFIRCTDAPIDQIARQVYEFARRPYLLQTPNGTQPIDLSAALIGNRAWNDYLCAAREEGGLVSSLQQIACLLPLTLVLIVDQAEEVLTLAEGEEGFAKRSAFFRFLREFQELGFDARIIVALRTEFYGRFIDAVRVGDKANEFKQFLLNDLSRAALIEAIVRPTRRDAVGPYPPPYDTYRFDYEKDLPEEIAERILAASHTGAALPVLQLVCLGLYNSVVRSGQHLIESKHFRDAGGVEGQIMGHLSGAVAALNGSNADAEKEVSRVRAALRSFYAIQDDGTVVSVKREIKVAEKIFSDKRVRVAPRDIINKLAEPDVLVLRKISTVQSDGRVAEEYTLGHDWIALALERWQSFDAESARRRAVRTSFVIRFYAISVAVLGAFLVVTALRRPHEASIFTSLLDDQAWVIGALLAFQVMGMTILTLKSSNPLSAVIERMLGIVEDRDKDQ